MNITLETILAEEFEESAIPEIISLLNTNGIYSALKLSLMLVSDIVNDFRETSANTSPQVEYIWSGLIVRIDKCLQTTAKLNNQSSKKQLIDTCNYIFNRSIEMTVRAVPDKTKVPLLKALKNTIVDTVNLFDIDSAISTNCALILIYADENIFKLEEINNQTDYTKIPGFLWKGKDYKTEEKLARFLKYKICDQSGLEKIRALFSMPSKNLNIVLNISNKDNVILFFYYLSNSGLISFINCRSVYSVLAFHVSNFKSDFMNNEEAYRVNFRISRNLAGQSFLGQLEADFRSLL